MPDLKEIAKAAVEAEHGFHLYTDSLEESRFRASFTPSVCLGLVEALEKIAATGCGCHPKCQCYDQGSLAIWRDEAQAIARRALEPKP